MRAAAPVAPVHLHSTFHLALPAQRRLLDRRRVPASLHPRRISISLTTMRLSAPRPGHLTMRPKYPERRRRPDCRHEIRQETSRRFACPSTSPLREMLSAILAVVHVPEYRCSDSEYQSLYPRDLWTSARAKAE